MTLAAPCYFCFLGSRYQLRQRWTNCQMCKSSNFLQQLIEQKTNHMKKSKTHFLDHASEDIKSLELNDPVSLDDLDPLALELFFSFDPLFPAKKAARLFKRTTTINVLMRRWVVWKFQASFEICWTCVAQYIYIHVELNSGSCQGNNGILKLAGTVWRQQKSQKICLSWGLWNVFG